MHIKRNLEIHVKKLAQQFPVVGVMGPRQSGKTTLVKNVFKDYDYVTLEDLDKRYTAKQDPRGFLATYQDSKGLIIDEVQHVPELLSYMQGIVDQEHRPGFYILTGSQHFLLYEKISQTLAGRIALLTLLPLSISELEQAGQRAPLANAVLIKGCYPRLYSQDIDRETWFNNYISTYLERDIRQIINIKDLISFQRLIQLCAARVGSLLNYASLARDAGISPNTAKAWISILEASFILKLVQPYHKNFNKRVVKSPKIYFYDTAIVCNLLGIKSEQELQFHPKKGGIFECLIMSELYKYHFNNNKKPNIYFWNDVQGHEIDAIIETSYDKPVPIEIKSGMTVNQTFFKGLRDWRKITEKDNKGYLVYSGENNYQFKGDLVIEWFGVDQMLDKIYE